MDYCGPKGIPLSSFLSWTVDDQDAALWWQAELNLRCRNCGTAEWEWEQDPYAYGVVQKVCKGCAMTQAAQRQAEEKTAGMKFSLAELMPGLQIRLQHR